MINSEQLTEKILGTKLLIYFENTDTILASINTNREIDFNVQFFDSLTEHAKSKIKHIATNNDYGYFKVNSNDEIEDFIRLMNKRPEIKVNDICLIIQQNISFGSILKLNESSVEKFRITKIYDNFCDMINIKNGTIFNKFDLYDIMLFKEYHENLYYIQNGFVGNAMCWWALDSKGYTTDIKKAHKFSKDEALSILKNNQNDKRRNERVWDCDYIDNSLNAHKTIIDLQYLEDIDKNELKL